MAPLPLRLVIVKPARPPTVRTLSLLHFRELHMNMNFTLLPAQLHPLHEPRSLDPKNLGAHLSILLGLLIQDHNPQPLRHPVGPIPFRFVAEAD